jgi:ATP-dependent exoDNAse (exonuclease V) beta subunit
MSDDYILSPRLIRASAGTGKTRDLSSRYIGLLARGETPDKILATTFTRKAAAEIRERIFSRLADASQNKDAASELGIAIGIKNFRSNDARVLLRRLVEQQHRLLITTLDALFISMARAFALELGLPINWRIGSDEDGKILKELAIRQILEDDSGEATLEIIRLIHGGDLSRSVHKKILDEVERLYRYFIAANKKAWNWIKAPETGELVSFDEIKSDIESYQAPPNSNGTPNKNLAKLITKLSDIHVTKDWASLGRMSIATSALEGLYEYYKKPLDAALISILDNLLAHARADITRRYRDRLKGIHGMLSLYRENYLQASRRLGTLTFDDVKERLASSRLTGELEPLYYRLDSKICHLLLDEFQDTSLNEWRVLEPIADEILSRPAERSFFCVGDMKQAIYGWRGGVAEIFGSVESRWPHLKPESKQTTYRCAPAIIELVNHLFGSLDKAPCLDQLRGAVARWLERFEPHQAAQKNLSGQVVVHRTPVDGNKSAFTVELVSELQQRYPGASIGVLVRKNRAVADLLARFSESHPGIAVSEEGAVKITDSALVRSLMSLLRALDHPSDTLAAFHVTESGLSEVLEIPVVERRIDDKWRREIRKKLLTEGYGAVISSWARILERESTDLDTQRLRQLVDQAYLYDLNRTTRIVDFAKHIERVTVELPSEAAIRVMSLHKAKGLEFDIVVLPELEDKIEVKRDEILVGQATPISPIEKIALGSGTEFERQLIPELGDLWQSKLDAITIESLSLLYVGVTRPKQMLHIVLPESGNIKGVSPAKIINEIFKDPVNGSVLFGADEISIRAEGDSLRPINTFISKKVSFSRAASASKAPHLNRVSPSRHTARVDLYNPGLIGAGDRARERGTALHQLFEQVDWIEDLRLDKIDMSFVVASLGHTRAVHLIEEFSKLVKHPTVISELSRDRFGAGTKLILKREQSFALRSEAQLISGVIDRLVIKYSDDKPAFIEIIDYKSDQLNGANVLEAKRDMYSEQLKFYAQAARSLVGASVPVVGKLLFLDGPVVSTVQL